MVENSMRTSWWLALVVLMALSDVTSNSAADRVPVDVTRQAGAAGANVVDTVIGLIEALCIFPDDKLFTRRLAYVESSDGTADKTYRTGYDGGIWQVICHVQRYL